MDQQIRRLEINPIKFYALCRLLVAAKDKNPLPPEFIEKVNEGAAQMDDWVHKLAQANNALLQEARQTSRRRHNPFDENQEEKDPFADLRHSIDDANFLRVVLDTASAFQIAYGRLKAVVEGLGAPEEVMLFGREIDSIEDLEDLQMLQIQSQMNQGAIQRFLDGVFQAEAAANLVIGLGRKVVDVQSHYIDRLIHRHATEGIQIHGDPVATDLALSIYENVDASGELKDGKKPDEISAYSIRKARIVAESIKTGLIGEFVRDAGAFQKWVKTNLLDLWKLAKGLTEGTKPLVKVVRDLLPTAAAKVRQMADAEFEQAAVYIDDLDPRNVTYKEPKGLLTAEERYNLDFTNETVALVVKALQDKDVTTQELIDIILDRKHTLNEYFAHENSFYVCKVGNGNPFTGEAPGMLTVIPGIKPVVNIDNVLGSGFPEVKEFILQVKESAKWHDLFLATSPSGSADKANCLLVGPQGCGKSEVLRAVGGDRRGVGIYAQPSDFLTCWKGEAEKNPKRLFEAAIRLQKETKKQVFILIDEVDTILNDDHARGGFGATNLTTEFQQLMDGIVQYPHIAVWAATNHPERLPMPMIRRFNKVAIVGELDAPARIKLLQHFLNFLPIHESFSQADWETFAEKLQGAVGDVIRKVADEVWRSKMTQFVRKHPKQAEHLVSHLNENTRFHLSTFGDNDRDKLKGMLAPFVKITPEDVAESLDFHLSNVAIRAEIATAVETYERSKKFLAGIKKSRHD